MNKHLAHVIDTTKHGLPGKYVLGICPIMTHKASSALRREFMITLIAFQARCPCDHSILCHCMQFGRSLTSVLVHLFSGATSQQSLMRLSLHMRDLFTPTAGGVASMSGSHRRAIYDQIKHYKSRK